MARNWMVNPRIHCVRHLVGAHAECHIFAGILYKQRKVNGYIKNNCLELENLIYYHSLLADEMLRRGYSHKSELNKLPDISYLNSEQINFKIDREKSLEDLLNRCSECRENYLNLNLDYIFV